MECGIPPDQGSNPCPLRRQADSLPLSHQGSLSLEFFVEEGRHDNFFSLETLADLSVTLEKGSGAAGLGGGGGGAGWRLTPVFPQQPQHQCLRTEARR